MTEFFFIRHAATDFVGRRIAGRSDGVPLTAFGRAQAERLAHRLAGETIAAVYTSPRERAQTTARPIAEATRCVTIIAPELDELDYGDWSGRTIAELEADPRWRAFNSARS